MPPIRSIPTIKPVKTERTHEENQERAYIAASRRSDRSLEARVESARRASEIHKKRTGRSLRVREEDVLNEEMYEEEDDDLPTQLRRINMLNPGLAYGAFGERVNSYLAGQLGVRNYLQQALFQVNQNQYANQFINPMMQSNAFSYGSSLAHQAANGQLNGQPSAQWFMPGAHGQSVIPVQEQVNHATHSPLPSKGANSPPAQQKSVQTPQQVPSPAPSVSSPHTHGARNGSVQSGPAGHDRSIYPLTTKLPVETQQLIDGNPELQSAVSPSQLNSGVPMPSMGQYSYNPNGKPRKESTSMSTSSEYYGLDQTLTPFVSHGGVSAFSNEPMSAASAPANLDYNFNNPGFYGDNSNYDDFGNYNFDINFGSGSNTGHVTPVEPTWNDTDFFNYAAASD